MTETGTGQVPEPSHPGFLAHLRDHLLPEVAALRADAEHARTAIPAALAGIGTLAGIIGSLARMADPSAGPEVTAMIAEADKAAAEAAAAAEKLLGKM